jgi:hypothetical protein
MDDDGLVRLLTARISALEEMVAGDRQLIEQLRDQLAKAVRAEVLRRADATGPLPVPTPVPQPRRGHRRMRGTQMTYLHIVKVATIGVLAAGVIAGAVIPASSIVFSPTPASAAPLRGYAAAVVHRLDAEQAGLCRGQLPDVGGPRVHGTEEAEVQGKWHPFGAVAYGGSDRIAYGRCVARPRR